MNSKEYKLIQKGDKIELFHIENEMINQETYLRITMKDNNYLLHMIMRADKRFIGLFPNEKLLISVIVVWCYRFFEEYEENNSILSELRQAAELNDRNRIIKLLQSECDEKFYSISGLKNNAICLVKNEDLYDVYYRNTDIMRIIVEGADFRRAIVVVRNFAKLLQKYDEMYHSLAERLSFSQDYYLTILEIYFFS